MVIKAIRLREPLVLAEIDGNTKLIDGRNRRAACKIADVDPEVCYLNGEEPKAYVRSANLRRRNLTTGQKAVAEAIFYPTVALVQHAAYGWPSLGGERSSRIGCSRRAEKDDAALTNAHHK